VSLNPIRNLKFLKYTNILLLIVSTLLFVFGLVMVFSASNISAFMRYRQSPYYFLIRQGIFLLIGLLGFLTVIGVETKNYNKYAWLGLLICIGMLIYAYFYGPDINDSRGWISLGSFNLQPSEIVKVVIIAWLATFFEIKKLGVNKLAPSLFAFGIAFAEAGLVVLANDFGTAAIIVLITYLMYILVPIDLLNKFKTLTIVTVGVAVVLVGYYVADTSSFTRQIGRFTNFGEPCSEEKFYTGGNQVCNSLIAFNNGNITGKGLGNSTQKYLYLPESHTDFIYAIIVEETGFVGGCAVLVAYLIILFTIIYIGSKSHTFRGSIICYGVAIYIFLHIAINLGGISGIIPLTGVPLPFLSYGGTFTICLIAGLSMVQRVAVENTLERKRIEQSKIESPSTTVDTKKKKIKKKDKK
jgi:cell division protein FtsW